MINVCYVFIFLEDPQPYNYNTEDETKKSPVMVIHFGGGSIRGGLSGPTLWLESSYKQLGTLGIKRLDVYNNIEREKINLSNMNIL